MEGKALVFGAGVIGSVYAVRLAKAGYEVTVVARGDRLLEIRECGLRIKNIFLELYEEAPVEAVEALVPGSEFDLALVTVRAGQIASALREVALRAKVKAIAVIGNNLGDYAEEAAIAGAARLVLGFGAFGGFRDAGVVAYVDGRTMAEPGEERRSGTTLGVLSPGALPALAVLRGALSASGLPVVVSDDIRSWLICHAALVFPLAGAIYACGGDQARTCRTRDALVLGWRACRELVASLRKLGYRVEPGSVGGLLALPEWFAVPMMAKRLAGPAATAAVFGHANAPGGRDEIAGHARALDDMAARSGLSMPNWRTLLPYFGVKAEANLIPDGSKAMRFRAW